MSIHMKKLFILCALFLAVQYASVHAQILPGGGERWQAGNFYEVSWPAEEFPTGSVAISLWDGTRAQWRFIANSVAHAGSYTWKIPAELEGDLFRIKVASAENPDIALMSGGYFFILKHSHGGHSGGAIPDSVQGMVHLSPNPAVETVQATWEGEAVQLRIWDIPGRSVYFLPLIGQNSASFSVAGILPGLYIVEVRLRNGNALHGRLIISR